MSNKEQKLRRTVRSLIQEELSPSEKQTVLDDLKVEIENIVNSVLIDHDVHKKGLSDQQCAKLYKELSRVVDTTLDDFKTSRKPSEIEGFENYEDYMENL